MRSYTISLCHHDADDDIIGQNKQKIAQTTDEKKLLICDDFPEQTTISNHPPSLENISVLKPI